MTFIDHLQNTCLVSVSELPVDFPSFFGVSHNNFIKDKLSYDILVNGVLLEFEIVISYRFAFDDLVVIFWIIELIKERVLQHFLSSESLSWIKCQKFAHKINCAWRS